MQALKSLIYAFFFICLVKSQLFAQVATPDDYQRPITKPSNEQINAQKAYTQLIEALNQKDLVKVKALKQLIEQLYPTTIHAQRLKRKGASTQLSIALISTLSIFMIDLKTMIKKD